MIHRFCLGQDTIGLSSHRSFLMSAMSNSPQNRPSQHELEMDVEKIGTHFAKLAEKRREPGVIVLSADGDLLYRNAEGESMTRQLLNPESGNGSSSDLPPEITDMCADLRKRLHASSDHRDWECVELRRIAEHPIAPVLIRGFLLPDGQHIQNSRLLILMEKLGRRARVILPQTKERFGLTNREVEIAKWIGEGRTNKEIAHVLNISEHTVKEHIRHLLRKTKSNTRTGILARLYQDD